MVYTELKIVLLKRGLCTQLLKASLVAFTRIVKIFFVIEY